MPTQSTNATAMFEACVPTKDVCILSKALRMLREVAALRAESLCVFISFFTKYMKNFSQPGGNLIKHIVTAIVREVTDNVYDDAHIAKIVDDMFTFFDGKHAFMLCVLYQNFNTFKFGFAGNVAMFTSFGKCVAEGCAAVSRNAPLIVQFISGGMTLHEHVCERHSEACSRCRESFAAANGMFAAARVPMTRLGDELVCDDCLASPVKKRSSPDSPDSECARGKRGCGSINEQL
jgi:hypothetical protein